MRVIPLQRVRVELDRALRGRSFIARAVRGHLGRGEYVGLVTELGALVAAGAGNPASPFLALAAADVRASALREDRSAPPFAPCFPGVSLLAAARASAGGLAPPAQLDVCLAVAGTSWMRTTARRQARRFTGATRFLTDLGARGPESLARINETVGAGDLDAHAVYAFAELFRGALLGLATHLDCQWPAPFVVTGPIRQEGEPS